MNTLVTILIAFVTFCWYRKGRLWNFYDSYLRDSIEQIKLNSIDRIAWEKIARDNCDSLGKELFNSLFRFELQYLRDNIMKNQHVLWIPDSESDGKKVTIYTNKAIFCTNSIEEMLYKDFQFCGFGLLKNSIKYFFRKKKEPKDAGYTETLLADISEDKP